MVNRNRLPKYSAEILDDNETIYFYIVQDVGYEEGHSIKTFIAPYTAAGRTQNLGRTNINLTYNIMLVNYFKDNILVSIEESFLKLQEIKRSRKKIRLSVPGLPLGSSIYFMGGINVQLRDPSRLIFSTNFVEILQDSIQSTSQNLVLNNSMENIKALLQQRGLV